MPLPSTDDRRQAVALFRYSLIWEAAEPFAPANVARWSVRWRCATISAPRVSACVSAATPLPLDRRLAPG
jgi:hypothetical protein